ncbi:MAG TPA: aldo/keto reductase [Acidimicrobiales bacterium]|nr:aldo/keto reductase [Acidimicrobiales bacterium]
MATHVPNLKLNNGVEIPQLGFGVFQVRPEDTVDAVTTALETGYRHIDTAEMYGNEKQVGQAIARSGIPRDEVFVTSKLNNDNLTYDQALRSFDQSLAELGFEHLDLFLIHWPLPTVRDFVEVWKALERVHSEERARSIGVSNFQRPHLERLLDQTATVPAVNQIELHPYLTQEPLKAFGESHGIATEAWSPIARGKLLEDPAVIELAGRVGRPPAQVLLRWHIQLGNIIFPKSVHPDRIRENFQLFDFALSDADLGLLSALNRDERIGPDPDVFDYVPD